MPQKEKVGVVSESLLRELPTRSLSNNVKISSEEFSNDESESWEVDSDRSSEEEEVPSHCGNKSSPSDNVKISSEEYDESESWRVDSVSSHRDRSPEEKLSSHSGNKSSQSDNVNRLSVSHRGMSPEEKTTSSCVSSNSEDSSRRTSPHKCIKNKLNAYAKPFHHQSSSHVACEESSKYTISVQRDDGVSYSQKNLLQLFETVYSSGVPNFNGCRIPIPFHKFNIPMWRSELIGYDDKIICDFLEFGFPLDFDKSIALNTEERRNHKGARDYPEVISQYINDEVKKCRIAGPFDTNPFSIPIMISPLNSVPKSSSDERRIIVDLSWPQGWGSVNSGISKEFYLEQKIELHYASVEDVCQMVLEIGKGATIYKRDLRQAYRQFPVDPADYYLLGYFWENSYFFDTVLAMGQRNAGVGCSRVTRAVMYIHGKGGYKGISYLDDLIGVTHPAYGWEAYEHLGILLSKLGLTENVPKACPPCTVQTVLGVSINTEKMTISITDERLQEISNLLTEWENKRSCKKKELQSIIGKLCFVCKCVRQSRVFLNRLLEVLRSVEWKNNTQIKLSDEFHKDVKWWMMFMETFNGVAFIPPVVWEEPDVTMATDSCLDGCGGICANQYFHKKFPHFISIQELPIHKLEFLAVLVGARTWGVSFSGLKIRIYCDNKAVVDVINSSKTKDPFMATCLRELWLVVSRCKFELRAMHLPGEENRVADWLSRWHLDQKYQETFNRFMSGDSMLEEMFIDDEMFKFSNLL